MGNANGDIIFIWLLLFGLIAYIFLTVYTALSNIRKSSDKGKKLIICKVKILKITHADNNMTLYVVEDENRNKHILRCFTADKINISPGDTGIIKYRGKTIKSFHKN
ncbi:MAG: hypothetical protein LUG66_05230 [Clostridiales bacterium]|nr:hypothetical protein [Clostridiales bacterium]